MILAGTRLLGRRPVPHDEYTPNRFVSSLLTINDTRALPPQRLARYPVDRLPTHLAGRLIRTAGGALVGEAPVDLRD